MWSWEAICILKNTLLRSVLFCWDVDGKVVVKVRNSPTERIKGPAFKAVFIVMCNMTTCLAFVDLFSLKDVHTHTHTHACIVYAGALRSPHYSLSYKSEKAPGNRLETSIQAGRDNNPRETRFLYLLHTEYPNTHSTGKVKTLLACLRAKVLRLGSELGCG